VSFDCKSELLFGPLDRQNPQPLTVFVGAYLARPNESVTVSELSRFGLKPVEVKLVSAEPSMIGLPDIVNKTTSLVVERVEEDRAEYRVFLRNASPVAVTALVASILNGDGPREMHSLRSQSGPFVASGEVGEVRIPIRAAGREPQEGASVSRPAQIVMEAATFEDGTYEGDHSEVMSVATTVEAESLGRKTQRQRIVTLVEEQLGSIQRDNTAKLVLLRMQASALPEEAEPAMVESIMAQFPELPSSAWESVYRDLQVSLKMEKRAFLFSLKQNEASKDLAQGNSLQAWWEATKGRFEDRAP
jgi:hypothetical protein